MRPGAGLAALLLVFTLAAAASAGDPRPHGATYVIAAGKLPSGGEFRLTARRFGREDLCLALAARSASATTCGERVPSKLPLSSDATVDCQGDTVVFGAVARQTASVRVSLRDGRRLSARIYRRPRGFKVKVRFYLLVVRGSARPAAARARDDWPGTLGVARFDFSRERCSAGAGFGGGSRVKDLRRTGIEVLAGQDVGCPPPAFDAVNVPGDPVNERVTIRSRRGRIVRRARTGRDGKLRVRLRPGRYSVRARRERFHRIEGRNPARVRVRRKRFSRVEFFYETVCPVPVAATSPPPGR